MATTKNEKLDHQPISFGKYRKKTPSQIAEGDSQYVVWAYENIAPKGSFCSEVLYNDCKADLKKLQVEREQGGYD